MKLYKRNFILLLVSAIMLFGCTQEKNDAQTQLKFRQGSIILDNSTVSNAILSKSSTTENKYSVKLKLKQEAAEKLNQYTSENVGKTFDVVANGKVIQSPTIMTSVRSEFLIDGLTKEQADSITRNLTCAIE